MEQTAVEWLIEQIKTPHFRVSDVFEQAKEMEKRQIIDTYMDSTSQFSVDARIDYPKTAEQYYNETFNK